MNDFASQFREAAADLAAAVEAVYGETVTITPTVTKPNYPATADPELKAFDVQAAFHAPYAIALADSEYQHGSLSNLKFPGVSTTEPTFTIRACALPHPVHRGYWLTRCATNEVYEVREVKPDSLRSTLTLRVQILGKPSQLEKKRTYGMANPNA